MASPSQSLDRGDLNRLPCASRPKEVHVDDELHDAIVADCPGHVWNEGRWVWKPIIISSICTEVVLNPDGTYYLNDVSG